MCLREDGTVRQVGKLSKQALEELLKQNANTMPLGDLSKTVIVNFEKCQWQTKLNGQTLHKRLLSQGRTCFTSH